MMTKNWIRIKYYIKCLLYNLEQHILVNKLQNLLCHACKRVDIKNEVTVWNKYKRNNSKVNQNG